MLSAIMFVLTNWRGVAAKLKSPGCAKEKSNGRSGWVGRRRVDFAIGVAATWVFQPKGMQFFINLSAL
jgi:hypothetical protein